MRQKIIETGWQFQLENDRWAILDHHPRWKRTNSTEQEPCHICHADLHQESQSCVSGAGGASSHVAGSFSAEKYCLKMFEVDLPSLLPENGQR